MLFLPVCSSLAENAKCMLRLYSDPANTDQRKGTNIVKRPPLLTVSPQKRHTRSFAAASRQQGCT